MYTIISFIATMLVVTFVPVEHGSIVAGAILFVGTLLSAQLDEIQRKFMSMQEEEAPKSHKAINLENINLPIPKPVHITEEGRQNIGVLALDIKDFEAFVQGHSCEIITAHGWGNAFYLKPRTADGRAQIINDGQVIVQYVFCDDITKIQGRVFTSVEQTERFHRHPNAIELGRKTLERLKK